MEIVSSKLILPPLGRSQKLENSFKSWNGTTKAKESRFSITTEAKQSMQTVIRKSNEVSEAVETPLPPLNQIEHQTNSESLKINSSQKGLRQTTCVITTRPKRTLSKVEKCSELVGKNKKRSSDQEELKEKNRAHKRNRSQKPTLSNNSKSTEFPKTMDDTSDEDDVDYNKDKAYEIDDKDTQEEGSQQEQKKKKKKKCITLLKDMVPLNLEDERQKFFELDFQYNPQFEYKLEDRNQKFTEPHKAYLKVAETILNRCIEEFGDDEAYIEITGSKLSTEEEITEEYAKYVKELDVENSLNLVFTDKIVSSASCLYKGKGKWAILVSLPIQHREKRVLSLFHHEIGTHYVRKFNERQQPWAYNRKQYNLTSCLVIEEGLAMLNQTLDDAFDPEGKPYLFSAALHYYACYKSSLMGLEELFKDLEKYIKDPIRRWKECIRVKRGISDTSKPGGMYKDQVYLRGAIEILQSRNKIDFTLLHLGKLNLKDLQRMIKSGLIKTDKMKIPTFLKDIDKYKAALDRIALFNSIDNLL